MNLNLNLIKVKYLNYLQVKINHQIKDLIFFKYLIICNFNIKTFFYQEYLK
jgi:hypothetical protein